MVISTWLSTDWVVYKADMQKLNYTLLGFLLTLVYNEEEIIGFWTSSCRNTAMCLGSSRFPFFPPCDDCLKMSVAALTAAELRLQPSDEN